jgi:L-ribulose-5-phosphate 3-epimerase
MREENRRRFLQLSTLVAAGTAALSRAALASVSLKTDAPAAADIRLGLFVEGTTNPDAAIKKVKDLGFPTCQVGMEEFTPVKGTQLKDALSRYGIEATALGVVGPGKKVWDFYEGPATIGIVPRATRRTRIDHIKHASDFAKGLGIPAIHTHIGFIPEDPNDALYAETVEAAREVATHCDGNGQILLYETGQESPITLLRAITDVGVPNQFVNLDTANLILYGKGNAVDALDVVGKLVRGVHAKDGLFPTNPKQLGKEVPIGQGKANFPVLIPKLRALGYKGAMTIEREVSGAQQVEDIKKEKAYLEKLLA